MAITITESWIRERVQLKTDNLEDVRSLTLPGTYQEKIELIGTALRNFGRLKHLDVSRNALVSLDGLEHHKLLEKLNLYYNNIETLDELYKLRHNHSLTELDLRLNPVTRNEPDYRLFLIHMLPSLKILDDRSVRDGERKAALVHYSTDQASEFKVQFAADDPDHVKQGNPRVEMINGLKKSSALDNDDVELLDLIARNGGNLSRPRNMTGSKASLPDVKIYTTDQILDLEKKQDNVISRHTPPIKESENPEKDKKHERKTSNASENGQDEKYPHITKKDVLGDIKLQNWAELVKLKLRNDPNLRFQDEAEAYNKVNTKAEGNFTAHPGVAPVMAPTFQANTVPYHPSILPHPEGIHAMHANFNIHPDDFHSLPIGVPPYYQYPNVGYPPVMRSLDTELTHQGRPCSNKSQSDHLSQFSEFLYQICDLVDKYWNGSKSLQHHQKFNALADEVIKDFVAKVSRSSAGDVKQLQDHVAQLSDNNTVLKQHSKNMSNDTEVNESLEQAKKDVEWLRRQLQKTIDENKTLQKKIIDIETSASLTMSAANHSSNTSVATDVLQQQNHSLNQEIEVLKIRLRQYSKMQDLANMLQESHKSLVETNDHLLQEIDETKKRHNADVQQLHWSYNQMKKSMTSQLNNSAEGSVVNGHI